MDARRPGQREVTKEAHHASESACAGTCNLSSVFLEKFSASRQRALLL